MPNHRARLGGYELDLRSGELYRDGQRVALPEQSFRILELLVACPGQVVTREEIRQHLWPNGTIVEFENAVNAAIKKLRAALGDSADDPHCIETIKRRGYRLIVPLEDSSSDSLGTSSSASYDPSGLTGKRVSHYHVLAALGAGGMGVVYQADDLLLGRAVALKFLAGDLSRNPSALERLRREARSASALNHPTICTIYEIGEEAGQPFIAMELLEGCSLRERISGSPLSINEVFDYGCQIAEGLDAAHCKGIVHRDIKPANIFITTRQVVKILDFGLAKTAARGKEEASHLTRPGAAAGTIAYMSPEQASAQDLDERSDLFSFGIVLYEMVTGHTPFRGNTDAEVAQAKLKHVRPMMSGGLDRIIRKCLEKDRNRRYDKASQILVDLQRLEHDVSTGARTGAKRWTLISVGAAAALVLSTGAYFFFSRAPKLTDRDSIVIADFVNKTGDSVFDGTLRAGLAIQLGQSRFFSVVPEDRIQNTLRLMNRSADASFTPQLAREVCERIGSAAVLQGSITRLGTQYVLGLQASSCRTAAELDNQQVQVGNKEEVLPALSNVARNFRSRAGESLAAVEKYDIPLQEATTPSLEALKAFNSARRMMFSAGSVAAVSLLKRAIEIDPQFAMAYASLGLTYSAMGESDLADESTAKPTTCGFVRTSARDSSFPLITIVRWRETWSGRNRHASCGSTPILAIRMRRPSLRALSRKGSEIMSGRLKKRKRRFNWIQTKPLHTST